jgi:hypothetical protein
MALPIIKCLYKGRQVDVPVCWPAERVDECVRLHPPDGIVDVDNPKGPGTLFENMVLKKMALGIIAKEDKERGNSNP